MADWYVLVAPKPQVAGQIRTACMTLCTACHTPLEAMGGPKDAICARCLETVRRLAAVLA